MGETRRPPLNPSHSLVSGMFSGVRWLRPQGETNPLGYHRFSVSERLIEGERLGWCRKYAVYSHRIKIGDTCDIHAVSRGQACAEVYYLCSHIIIASLWLRSSQSTACDARWSTAQYEFTDELSFLARYLVI